MIKRAQYADTIAAFLRRRDDDILGKLAATSSYNILQTQRDAWREQIQICKGALAPFAECGKVYFEYSIPRLGRRIDTLLLIDNVIFVVEFKTGADKFSSEARRQVCDYALDLKNFHETSHKPMIAPVLLATAAAAPKAVIAETPQRDNLLQPINANAETFADVIGKVLAYQSGERIIPQKWEKGGYHPTPTIIEAATALYRGHSVDDISRSDAGATNLSNTAMTVADIIKQAKANSHKAICFITGVPGAGKTLVGLNIASQHNNSDINSVFLSGNAPLVNVLREALARDKIRQNEDEGKPRMTKKDAHSAVQSFIQNVHHFRDDNMSKEALQTNKPPPEKVALFDEAQRAWDKQTLKNFLARKKGIRNFDMSESEFLISCLDRHSDWATIVCLVGGGQEIKSGEAGIGGWIDALVNQFPHWRVYVSSHLHDAEYAAGKALAHLQQGKNAVMIRNDLHLSASMRSFRAKRVAELVKRVLDMDDKKARQTLDDIARYPIALTRDLHKAKEWLRTRARGNERYGMIVSSHAERLRPHAIDVRPRINPVHWFLHDRDDIRSSYYLEDVVTEFEVQGLEVDWACITWDADMRYTPQGWQHRKFRGRQWQHIRKADDKIYQKNAYRVLLTRARQGMVIVVPEGDNNDATRKRNYYDPIFNYLKTIGFPIL